jgi:hypothetical protein
MNMFKKLIYLVLPAFMMAACNFAEDISDCGNLRLNLMFTHNEEYVDLLAENVRDIRLYIFDEATDLLVRVLEPTEAEIAQGWVDVRQLPAGAYSIVAWGGSGTDMLTGGYIEMAGGTEGVTVGETILGQLNMILESEPTQNIEQGDVKPTTGRFDDLFYASTTGIGVDISINQSADIDFIRNSHILEVTVTGTQYLTEGTLKTRADALPLDLWAVGSNGRYDILNQIDGNAPEVLYRPFESYLATPDDMITNIQTLRIDIARHGSIDPFLLNIENSTTGLPLVEPLNVVAALAQVRDTQGNYLYDTQDKIDRQYILPIEISILKDLSVSISINDWVLQDLTPII